MEVVVEPEMETSAFVEVFTAVLPFILLVIVGVSLSLLYIPLR